VVANTGWTWEDALDNLTLPRFLALREQWREHPPTHWLVAAAMNFRPPGRTGLTTQPSVKQIEAIFPGGRL
jgi:hypothetical protein